MKNLFRLAALFGFLLTSKTGFAATDAQTLLEQRNAEFEQEVIQVAPDVYTAVGFGVSPTSMIVGKSGVIIIDTQLGPSAARSVLEEFRKITTKPVKGIIFTHGHGDHTGGADVFISAGENVEIWAREGLGEETRMLPAAGLTIQNQRGMFQGGFFLDPKQRINNGVAQNYAPPRGEKLFSTDVEPTDFLTTARTQVKMAGVKLSLVAASGETDDGLYVWYEKNRVLFSGDNFYKSWPNTYAVRGTPYRDVLAWINSLSSMIDENPDHLVGGHTRPVLGHAQANATLINYRDAIQSIFEQTIEGMNRGLTPDELVEVVKLPEKYAELDYLREYYGNIEWSVRAIYSGYLGWFDGNPSNLFPLSKTEEAEKIAALAGGVNVLLEQARSSLEDNPQWSAQLCDYVLALNEQSVEAKSIKAEALEQLGQALLTTTGRNYYLSVARKLREQTAGANAQ